MASAALNAKQQRNDAIFRRWKEIEPDHDQERGFRRGVLKQLAQEFGRNEAVVRFVIKGAWLRGYHARPKASIDE